MPGDRLTVNDIQKGAALAQVRQADALERIAVALERIADYVAPSQQMEVRDSIPARSIQIEENADGSEATS